MDYLLKLKQLSGSLITSEQTASMSVLSASYAATSSLTDFAISASYASSSTTASYASASFISAFSDTASYAFSSSYSSVSAFASSSETASYAHTASYVKNAQSASYVLNAISASHAETASFAVSASYAPSSVSASNAISASYAENAGNANTATTASYALTASYVENAQTASYVENAVTASYIETASYAISASDAVTASYIETASYALNAGNAIASDTASYVLPLNQTVEITGSLLLQSSSISEVDYIDFNPTKYSFDTGIEPAYLQGRLFYDSGSGALTFYNWEPDTKLNIGQDNLVRVRNQTGVTITKGSAVRLIGAVGSRPTIELAQSQDQVQTFGIANDILGLTTEDILNGQDGFVSSFGTLENVDTSNFSIGDLLWVSQSAGLLTNVVPDAPYDKIFVGTVTRDNASNGTIFISPRQPFHFHDITSVSASTYTHGDLFMFVASGSSGYFINTKQLSGSYVITGSLTVDSLIGTASWADNVISSSYATTASYLEGTIASASYAATASYVENAQTASYVENAQTASYVENAQTASYVLNAISASYVETASFADNSTSASYAETASYALGGEGTYSGSFYGTSSHAISSSFASTASYADFAVTASYVTTSIFFVTGGGNVGDIQYKSGSDGVLNGVPVLTYVGGQLYGTGSFSGSFDGTASWAESASNAINAITASYLLGTIASASYATTASYVENAQTASYIETASFALSASNAVTASYIVLAQSASFVQLAQSASYIETASYAISASDAVTASYVELAQSASYIETASFADSASNAVTASYIVLAQSASYIETASFALSASNAVTASYVEIAQTASYIATASWAVSASQALTASYVENAQTASYIATASFANSASNAVTASYIETASWANNAVNAITASYVEVAQTASYIETASYAISSSNTVTASYVEVAQTASYVATASWSNNTISASYASTASYIETASWANNAVTASYVGSSSFATTASFAENFPETIWAQGAGTDSTYKVGNTGGASGSVAVAQGKNTNAHGEYSHTEGGDTTAYATGSHVEGSGSTDRLFFPAVDSTQDFDTYFTTYVGFSTITRIGYNSGTNIYTGSYDDFGAGEGAKWETALNLGGNITHDGVLWGFDFSYPNTVTVISSSYVGNTVTLFFQPADTSVPARFAAGAFGFNDTLGTEVTIATGSAATKFGDYAHAEGLYTTASALGAHAEGYQTLANNTGSHAGGYRSLATGSYSFAHGYFATASGDYATALGNSTSANGIHSLAIGSHSLATGNASLAKGGFTTASGHYSHAEGWRTHATAAFAHAEGSGSIAGGIGAHAEGRETIAGQYSHTEGYKTTASFIALYSHVEGEENTSNARGGHVEGIGNFVLNSAFNSHTEGSGSRVGSQYSHTEGMNNRSWGVGAHAEGFSNLTGNENSILFGWHAHAEGMHTNARATGSHTEGSGSLTLGFSSHAEGFLTTASGQFSHAEGIWTIASGSGQLTIGKYNRHNNPDALFVIGNGTADNDRSDLLNAYSQSIEITGSLLVTEGITGSFNGTASYADTAGTVISASFATTASYAATASYFTSSVAIGGGNIGDIQYKSGSDGALDGVPVLTYVAGALVGTGSFSGSLSGSFTGSAIGSLIGTSSWAENAETSSKIEVQNTTAANYYYPTFVSLTAGTRILRVNNEYRYRPDQNRLYVTSSDALWSLNAVSSSAATTSSYTHTSSFATTASYAENAAGTQITALDEGIALTTALASLDFVGAGVSASVIGNSVTVNVPGLSGSSSTVNAVDSFWDLATTINYSDHIVNYFDSNTTGSGGGIFRFISESNTAIKEVPGYRIATDNGNIGYWERLTEGGTLKVDWFGVNGSASTLSSLGVTQAVANARYGSGSVNVDTDTYDWAAIKMAFTHSESLPESAIEFTGGRIYKVNRGIKLPRFRVNSSGTRISPYFFDIQGKWCHIETTPSYTDTHSTTYQATYNGTNVVVINNLSEIGAVRIGDTVTGIFGTATVTGITSITSTKTTIQISTSVSAGTSNITVTQIVALFDRVPPNQDYALSTDGGYVNSRFNINNFHFENTVATWGDNHYGIRVGPSYGSNISFNEFTNFNRNLFIEFCLNATIDENQGSCLEYHIYGDYGEEWGGSNSDSQNNISTLNKNRAYCTGTREKRVLRLTGGASSAGNIEVVLDGITYLIPVSIGSATAVANEVYSNNQNSSNDYYLYFGDNYTDPPDLQGWDLSYDGSTNITFTARVGGVKTGSFSFSGGSTGVTAVLSQAVAGTQNTVAAFFLRGNSGLVLNDNVIEGFYPQYGIYFDSDNSSVVHDFYVRNTHIETSCGKAAIYIRTTSGNYIVDGIFNQYNHKNFIMVENLAGLPAIEISNLFSQLPLVFGASDNGVLANLSRMSAGNGPQVGSVQVTGDITNASNVITNVSDTSNIDIGDRVSDYRTIGASHYIPMGAIVRSKTASTLTLEFKNGDDADATGTASSRFLYAQDPDTGNYEHPYSPLIWRRGEWEGVDWVHPTPLFTATTTPGSVSSAENNHRIFYLPRATETISNNPYSGI